MDNTTQQPLPDSPAQLARIIARDWENVDPNAKPYLQAMYALHSIGDKVGMNTGSHIVIHFLAFARNWTGDTAQQVKSKLSSLVVPSSIASPPIP
ncbi:hypothetical protein EGT74_06570 [Chitinophaga lutea]|uniref:Uncharacterized protein n=1 Tax=Chitinophaga lutea TaxID=2488634 RepID=A0A3N4QB22_9BACT|nr:hypothetical protein [Chitinophaga lutea]RPE13190.1 hypothetical protein EGT74_06570 [Chitinophaga lutea]